MEEKIEKIIEDIKNVKSTNPMEIALAIMGKDYISIHGPEHHILDGLALLFAIYNTGFKMDLDNCIQEFLDRAKKMPGAMCAHWGVCGSVTSVSSVVSILNEVGPLTAEKTYADNMKLSSGLLKQMSEIGGPRCCKRNARISLIGAAIFVKENYAINLEIPKSDHCKFKKFNKECLGTKCPFA